MVAAVVVVMMVAVMVTMPVARAEVVPCSTGKEACLNATSLSISNGEIVCCAQGFGMNRIGRLINGSFETTCTCKRNYYESDCLQGTAQCENATSIVGDKCCSNGESMTYVSHALINGEPVSYCKCRQHIAYTVQNGVLREMTDEEKAQLNAQMTQLDNQLTQWASDFSQQMSQWANNLNRQMTQLSNSLSNLFGRHARSTRGKRPKNFLDMVQK